MKVCPDLILVPTPRASTGPVSRQMFDLCETLTPEIQRNSIDEGYLDLGPVRRAVHVGDRGGRRGLQRRIWDELRISVSMGIAGTSWSPRSPPSCASRGLCSRAARGRRRRSWRRCRSASCRGGGQDGGRAWRHGLRLVGDLLHPGEDVLRAIFGRTTGGKCAGAGPGRGRQARSRPWKEDAKSYSQQETFAADVGDFAEIERVAKRMLDELMPKVRADGKRVRTLTIKVRYPDFSQASHGRSLEDQPPTSRRRSTRSWPPSCGPAWTAAQAAPARERPAVGVEDRPAQLEMFAQGDERRRRLAGVLDRAQPGRIRTGRCGQAGPPTGMR
jgi:DNA polymerase-4